MSIDKDNLISFNSAFIENITRDIFHCQINTLILCFIEDVGE